MSIPYKGLLKKRKKNQVDEGGMIKKVSEDASHAVFTNSTGVALGSRR